MKKRIAQKKVAIKGKLLSAGKGIKTKGLIENEMKKKQKLLTRKVYSRVTPETYRRLDEIRIKYGFRSVYEIIQSLVHCFLRAAFREDDLQQEPLPYDIEEMFAGMAEGERHVEFEKPKRRKPHKTVNNE